MNRVSVILGVAALGSVCNAQIIFDNTATENGNTIRNGGDAPALQITNTNSGAVTLTSVAFLGQINGPDNFDFFLTDSSGNVISQVFQSENITGPNTLIGTAVNWTLAPGQTYYIGGMSQSIPTFFDYTFPSGFIPQNGLQSAPNGNFITFGAPTFAGNGAADMAWQLQGSAVPEPGMFAAMGLGLLGIALRRRR